MDPIRFAEPGEESKRSMEWALERHRGAYKPLVSFLTNRVAGFTRRELEMLVELPPRKGVDGDYPGCKVERLGEKAGGVCYAITANDSLSVLIKIVDNADSSIECFCKPDEKYMRFDRIAA